MGVKGANHSGSLSVENVWMRAQEGVRVRVVPSGNPPQFPLIDVCPNTHP